MLIYPQLMSGALSQFPIVKERRVKTVVNTMPGGSSIRYPEPASETVEWQLQYTGLSDDEAAALEAFFTEAEGSLREFTFLDPGGNLLAWGEDLNHAAWVSDPFLVLAPSIDDPNGGTAAWRATNSGAGSQSLTQTLNVPVEYTYCLSVYARAPEPTAVTLRLGSQSVDRILTSEWGRITLTGSGSPGDTYIDCGVELQAGTTVDLYGIQVEPQGAASTYKVSSTGGVYENARFRDDAISIIAMAPDQNSTTLKIFHANHL